MSSSDSSDSDEDMKNVLAAVDTSFINDSMFKDAGTKKAKVIEKPSLPSQRNVKYEENIFKSEIQVTKQMQNFTAKKLSEMIESQIEFCDSPSPDAPLTTEEIEEPSVVKLFKGTSETIKFIEPIVEEVIQVKPKKIKKRKIESEEVTEEEKIAASVVPNEEIHNTKLWKSRQKPKLFEYKNKKGIGYLKEPDNEFTKTRKKNNWDESKIKDFKKIKET